MKYLFYCLMAISVVPSCNKEDIETPCAIEGRWNLEGFDNTLYEFHEGLRYTIYTDSAGVFGPRADAIPNPKAYTFDNVILEIDLNFGNISRSEPSFKCDCQVVELFKDNASSVLYREGFELDNCTE